MLGLFALPTPPQDEQEVNPKGPSTYALPAISGQPPPPDIFYRPTAEPQPRASGSRSPSWPRRHPGSPPTPPERQVLYEGVGSKSLPIEDRPVMFALMSLGTSPADCRASFSLPSAPVARGGFLAGRGSSPVAAADAPLQTLPSSAVCETCWGGPAR